MDNSTVSRGTGPSGITHGSVQVLAYLNETEAVCSEVARETGLAKSSAYRCLIELEEAGILTATATRREKNRPVVQYRLDDEDLGASARLVVDRFVSPGSTSGIAGN